MKFVILCISLVYSATTVKSLKDVTKMCSLKWILIFMKYGFNKKTPIYSCSLLSVFHVLERFHCIVCQKYRISMLSNFYYFTQFCINHRFFGNVYVLFCYYYNNHRSQNAGNIVMYQHRLVDKNHTSLHISKPSFLVWRNSFQATFRKNNNHLLLHLDDLCTCLWVNKVN